MRVLVTGAFGFIGSHIVAALVAGGHEVVCAARGARVDRRFPGIAAVACDMARDTREEDWRPHLAGIDAVVNCAGILRERRGEAFEDVHVRAPLALFRACATTGVRRVVQISAIGSPEDDAFVASKHRCDAGLAHLDLDWTVLRPSLVYSARGSYGGTSLLRALAALPGVLLLPGSGAQRLQPVAAEDVGAAVVAALGRPEASRQVFELVGPDVLALRDYLRSWRRWLGLGPARVLHVPPALVRIATACGEWLGRGPLGETMRRMLERGNVGAAGAWEHARDRLGVAARPLTRALAEAPAQVQDRWHARLYLWLPLLRVSLALLWIASGLVGLLLPAGDVRAATSGIDAPAGTLAAARIGGALDLALGALCLVRWRPRLVLGAMLLMLAGYTLGIGVLWPQHWLDPFGGLLKNLPLAAALAALLAVEERR